MTQTHVELRRGAYADSVTLLQVTRTVQGLPGVVSSRANVNLLRVDLDAATSKKLDLAFTPASLNRLPDGSSVLVRDTTGAVHLLSPDADQVVGTVAAVAQ